MAFHGNQPCVLLYNFLFNGYRNLSSTQSSFRDRVEIGVLYLLSQLHGAYTTTLYMIVDIVKGDGLAPPTLTSLG